MPFLLPSQQCWAMTEVYLIKNVVCVMIAVSCDADDASKPDLWSAVVSTDMSVELHRVTAYSEVLSSW